MDLSELTGILWPINLGLAAIAVALVIFVWFYSILKNYRDHIRNSALLKIKKNIHGMAGSKKPYNCPVVRVDNTEEFLDITMNRDTILFNKDEREYIKKCFAEKGNLDHIRRVAEKSRNKWQRIEALLSLGYAEDAWSLPILEGGLFNKDEDISYFSMMSLSEIKNRDSACILLAFLKTTKTRAHAILSLLEKFGPDIDDDILELSSSEDPKVRYWAVKLITTRDMLYAADSVKKLLSDPSPDVRSAACDCIGRLKETTAKDELIERLGDGAWFVRMNAVRALSRIYGKNAMPNIFPLILDPAIFVKESVKSAIAKDVEAAIPYIGSMLEEGDPLSKQEVIEALETSGYIKRVLDDIAYKDGKDHSLAFILLEKMLKASVRFGIGSAAERYDKTGRTKILAAVRKISPELAGRIEKNWTERGIENG